MNNLLVSTVTSMVSLRHEERPDWLEMHQRLPDFHSVQQFYAERMRKNGEFSSPSKTSMSHTHQIDKNFMRDSGSYSRSYQNNSNAGNLFDSQHKNKTTTTNHGFVTSELLHPGQHRPEQIIRAPPHREETRVQSIPKVIHSNQRMSQPMRNSYRTEEPILGQPIIRHSVRTEEPMMRHSMTASTDMQRDSYRPSYVQSSVGSHAIRVQTAPTEVISRPVERIVRKVEAPRQVEVVRQQHTTNTSKYYPPMPTIKEMGNSGLEYSQVSQFPSMLGVSGLAPTQRGGTVMSQSRSSIGQSNFDNSSSNFMRNSMPVGGNIQQSIVIRQDTKPPTNLMASSGTYHREVVNRDIPISRLDSTSTHVMNSPNKMIKGPPNTPTYVYANGTQLGNAQPIVQRQSISTSNTGTVYRK